MHVGHMWHSSAFLGFFNCLDELGRPSAQLLTFEGEVIEL
jgi:hypothetical protein